MAEDDDTGGVDIQYFLEDLSEEQSTRVAGAVLIIGGSLIGVVLGLLLVSSNPNQILAETLDPCAGAAIPKGGADLLRSHTVVTKPDGGMVINVGTLQYGQPRDFVVRMTVPSSSSPYLQAKSVL